MLMPLLMPWGFFAKDVCLTVLYQYQTTKKEVNERARCKILLSFTDKLVFLWLYTTYHVTTSSHYAV